jgi:uncharacterized protein (DUF1015 family)
VERVYKGLGIGYNVSGSTLISPSGLEINGRNKLVDIRAFRGTFYNPQVVEDLSRAIAPPYDVIDDRKNRTLLSRSPYNIVRLILQQPGSGSDFWNDSTTLFNAWKKGDVLIRDSESCLYVYRQEYELPWEGSVSRTGILALLRCKDFSTGEILPHEKTFAHTQVERLNLLRTCRANFSQIFTVFRDEGEEVLDLMEDATSNPPFIEFSDGEGVVHQVWRVREGEIADMLVGSMAGKRLIIADGHHRYETALNYSKDDHRTANAAYAAAYVSVALFRSEDPGLVILPVHRLLHRLGMPVEEAYRRLQGYFHVEIIQSGIGDRMGMFKQKLESLQRPAFIMVTAEGAALCVLREGIEPKEVMHGPESAEWKSLDVSILHSLVLTEGLGLDASELAEKGDLYFTPWESDAMSALDAGEAEAAFLVRPTRMDEIWKIAECGERMPHKSSYFYPKLPSGLLIYDHDGAFS